MAREGLEIKKNIKQILVIASGVLGGERRGTTFPYLFSEQERFQVCNTYLTDGDVLSCVCTTDHCKMANIDECITRFKCYTQYMPRSDGGDPISLGCISGNTPLLCENRLPAISNRTWPYLICCNYENFCNRHQNPTAPPWNKHNQPIDLGGVWTTPSSTRKGEDPIGNMTVIVVVFCGIVLLALIIALGFHILKKQSETRLAEIREIEMAEST